MLKFRSRLFWVQNSYLQLDTILQQCNRKILYFSFMTSVKLKKKRRERHCHAKTIIDYYHCFTHNLGNLYVYQKICRVEILWICHKNPKCSNKTNFGRYSTIYGHDYQNHRTTWLPKPTKKVIWGYEYSTNPCLLLSLL